MNRKHLFHIALMAFMVVALPVQARKGYSCNFENEADRARWTLNPAAGSTLANLTNKWYIGEAGNNDKSGHYGLYISDDGGATAHYTNKGCWVFAYDTVALDHLSSGDYTLFFDYCAMGNMTSNFDGLYLLWIPMTNPDSGEPVRVNSIATSTGTIPPAYENYVIPLQSEANLDCLNGASTWRQCAVTIPNKDCDGTPHYLAFVWANSNFQIQEPGGMIDNITIMDTRPCDAPTNLKLTIQGTTSTITWDGTVAEYEAMAYSYASGTWYGPKTVTGNTTSFASIPMGEADFIVRAKCTEDLYSLKTILNKLVYYPDQMCVDYLNLDNAKCYVANTQPKDTRTFNDFKQVPAVDNGPAQSSSRHTIHFDHNELDPRTGNVAKTIPDGELASVRLGNWEHQTNEGAEQIEFSFNVDTIEYPVLLLKYMPVIEAPNHSDYENSRFTLDILINGQSIGACGKADFNANDAYNTSTHQLLPGAAEQGWHLVPPGTVDGGSTPVVWKDWTTVGVNLRKPEYQGKKLTARLATYDCIYNAHYGYAYFTLGCSDGKLKGMKCGSINPVFEAPDGFAYRWAYAYNEKYRRPDGSLPEQYVLGHGQQYEAGMKDDSLYVVDCMFVQDSSCFFSLYASTLATNPVAEMKKPRVLKNCQADKFVLRLDASPSWVQEIDHVKGDTLVSQIYHIDRYEWNIEGPKNYWSDEESFEMDLPSTGGDYTISLTTTCGICDSTIVYHLHLDPLAPTYDTVNVVLCDDVRKTGYVWPEKPDTLYHDYGLDSVVLLNMHTSCDSFIYLRLTEPERVFVDTMMLPESLPLMFHGRIYEKTTVDTVPISASNCDTTWILNFEVYESILVNMKNAYVLCEGDPTVTLTYDITRGRSLRYSYTFDDPAIPSIKPVSEVQRKGHYELPVALSPTLYPNVYEGSMLFEDSLPKFNVTVPFTLTMQYSSDVITQRWNDVLAIRNADYNGGYQFDSVQWYVNGTAIEGATDFNYYTGGNGVTLRFGDEYTALLKRTDGVKLFTCAFVPVAVPAEVTDMPTLVPLSAPMTVKGKGTAYWYDLSGRMYRSEPYNTSDITAPAVEGYYLLVLQGESTRSIHPVLVR
ncbi:MAG: hypothetical protein J5761_05570 [Paludibacteraceae bacterium]|nr:hypothetical protein [Paludibacteraceae bacterium]